jgi:hypothetical protein
VVVLVLSPALELASVVDPPAVSSFPLHARLHRPIATPHRRTSTVQVMNRNRRVASC